MAAFFLFPRVLFVELLDFYRFQNTRFYLYILSLFAIRLFIGQAFPRNRKRQDFAPKSGQTDVHRDARQVLRSHLPKAQRSGCSHGDNALTGRVIDDDMFGVCRRLKSIDDGYFVFLNYKTGKFEVHNKKDARTLCLVLPYDRLDERTVRRVLYTRAERVAQITERMERDNARIEARRIRAAVDGAVAACAGGGAL